MSYLVGSGVFTDSTRATISLWFRIPKESIDAAAAEFEAAWNSDPDSEFQYDGNDGWHGGPKGFATYRSKPPQMAGIIPLVVFGKKGSESPLTQTPVTFGSFHYTTYLWHYTTFPDGYYEITSEGDPEWTGSEFGSGPSWETEPSYIGVWCTKNPERTLLAINLETGHRASAHKSFFETVDIVSNDRQFYGGGAPPARTWTVTQTFGTKNPGALLPKTESFRTHPYVQDVSKNYTKFGTKVSPDHWHHLLLSFDLSAPCSTHGKSTNDTGEIAAANNAPNPSSYVNSAPKIWIAFDDKNKTGIDLSYYRSGKDPNEVLSRNGWHVAGLTIAADSVQTEGPSLDNETVVSIYTGLADPEFDSGKVSVPMGPMGLPATADLVEHVRHVEMAEFMLWAGEVRDTSGEQTRRAFIDSKGKPVPPSKKSSPDSPQSGAIEFMSREPDVMLHKSSNWKKGKNTGASPEPFTPTGEIKTYKPDPSLHGPQEPSKS